MARRKVYTVEDAKFVKHLRNKMYYLKKKMEPLQAKWNFRYEKALTFQAIQHEHMSNDERYELKDLWNSNSDTYYILDFRQVAIYHPEFENVINDISYRAGYGTIEEYRNRQATLQEIEAPYENAKFVYDEFRRLAKES